MRLVALVITLLALAGGSAGAFEMMRAIGPEDRTGQFGVGGSSDNVPGGGTLFDGRAFARVVEGIRGQVGSEGRVVNLSLQPTGASVTAIKGNEQLSMQLDGAGHVDTGNINHQPKSTGGSVGINRITGAAMDKLIAGVRKEAGTVTPNITSMSLSGQSREWNVSLSGGDVSTLVANLDGSGVRLSGEDNPVPAAAQPDSLLREPGFNAVLETIAEQVGSDAKLAGLTVYPSYAVVRVLRGSRQLSLNIGYEGQLTSRQLEAPSGVGDEKPIALSNLQPDIVSRMVKTARKVVKGLKLADVAYVTDLTVSIFKFPNPPVQRRALGLYLAKPKKDVSYVATDLSGRKVLYPNK